MATYELIQSRNISGKGVLKVPPTSQNNRAYILYADLLRPPKNPYTNTNYNPSRSKYGFLTFLRGGYVLHDSSIQYPRQAYDGVNDISGQTLIALKCVNNAILQSLYNLSVALAATPGGQGLNPLNFTNVISAYENLNLSWDECRVTCYADAALTLRLYRLKYDACNAAFDNQRPVPVPPPVTQTPAGQPLTGVDRAYDEPNDNGLTVPYSGDALAAPKLGSWLLTWTLGTGGTSSGTYPGIYSDSWAIVRNASNVCTQSGNSTLVKNGSTFVVNPFNCNSSGFVSALVSAVFTPPT